MAYGKTDEELLYRAVSIGVGDLTDTKLSALLLLRERYLEVANRMAAALFVQEPLTGYPSKAEMDVCLRPIERSLRGYLNQAYVQKVGIAVKEAVFKVHERYKGQLVGRLAHCFSKIKDPQSQRHYYYVPEEIQDKIFPEELSALEKLVEERGFEATLELFRRVALEGDPCGLTEHQVAVVREIHRQVQERHRPPVFGRDPEFVCQIHLDGRVVREEGNGAARIDEAARLLFDNGNVFYHTFLEISHPVPRGPAVRIPLSLSKIALARLCLDEQGEQVAGVNSLIVEIEPGRVKVKAVIAKDPPLVRALNECEHLIGRDFGYNNTIALSVVRRKREIKPEQLEEIKRLLSLKGEEARKEAACRYFTTHRGTLEGVVHRVRFSGERFLDLIEKHARKIDRLRSEIDHIYNRIDTLKGILSGYLKLGEGELVKREEVPKDPLMEQVHRRFFELLDHVGHLKGKRRSLYNKIAEIKKHWFGFLGNWERELARKYRAAVVREDLTVEATEKDSPEYRGRTFNRMINDGAKGQYIRRARDKLLWDGIPEVVIPSYYTSCTCVIHSRVDKRMRRKERFLCPLCSGVRHADEHAADTIANYLLLVPT